ncbi:glycosyltransferase family 2 protein [Cyclobacterium xiamenense]|uniref:glycosyltransferase family 2 protein n=1 Tax=Cyclobacterium xiamenense TaxID=1297121 RepID=UPI0035D0D4E5
MKKAAVVILNFNGKGMLRTYLSQVVHRSLFEIIVVDNGSTDGSIDYLTVHFPEIRLLLLGENHGYSKGYNLGLQSLQGEFEYYLLLNSDVEVVQGWDEALVNYMEGKPVLAACQPKVLSLKKSGYFDYAGGAGGYLDRLGYPYCRGRMLHTLEKDKQQYDRSQPIDWASGACFCIRAELFHEFGGFNPNYFSHMEEIDLCWRLRNAGFQIHHCSDTRVYHLGGGTLAATNPFKTYLNFRNSLFMLYSNLKSGSFWLVFCFRVLLDTAAALHLWLGTGSEQGKAVCRAYLDFLKDRNQKAPGSTIRVNRVLSESSTQPYSLIVSYYLLGKRYFSSLT